MNKKIYESVFWRKRKIIIPCIIILIVIICSYVYVVREKNKVFKSYKVKNKVEVDSKIQSKYQEFEGGILRYSSDGISFYKNGREVFNKAVQMTSPVVDVRGSYIVMAERKSTQISLFDVKGNQVNVTATHAIIDITVSENGVIAAILDDGTANYIELYDKNGVKLVSGRTVLEGDGYPISIALSGDATRLIASYLAISEGQAQSKVIFYNYSSVGENEVDRIVGGFNQYKDSIVPEVNFINNKTAVAVGDNMFTIYQIDEKPSIQYEQEFDGKVETVFYSSQYIGIVFESNDQSYAHVIKVYDKNGKKVYTKSTDFNYSDISFAGENIVMNDEQTCLMYSFQDKERFNKTFETKIVKLVPVSDRKFIFGSDNEIQEIELK